MLTPKSKTKQQIKSGKIKDHSVKKSLLFANTVAYNMRSKNGTTNNYKPVKRLMSAKILKKYRCMTAFSKEIGVSRSFVKRLGTDPNKKNTVAKIFREQVVNFLEREDNNTMLPGKKDVLGGQQKRVLNDFMYNLHKKFIEENPNVKMSLTVFMRLRPPYIVTTGSGRASTCLCMKHQNMTLIIRAINAQVMRCTTHADAFMKTHEDPTNIFIGELPEKIKYNAWEKAKDDEGKLRWVLCQKEVEMQEFKELFFFKYKEFTDHRTRISVIDLAVRKLKEDMPANEVLLWMDFAENFTCTVSEQVQSAYWNQAAVTLHTMVMYYKLESGLLHQSYVAISDDVTHNSTSVFAILHQVVPKIKERVPNVKKINYLTDSPTSQYRNKTIFQVVSYHDGDFGLGCRWFYLEAGHGKGPCDGLGASVKRSASTAIFQQKATIQSADDFYLWASEQQKCIEYLFVSKEDCSRAKITIEHRETGLKRVIGTMKIHAVVPIANDQIYTRDLPCCCDSCLASPSESECGWVRHSLRPEMESAPAQPSTSTADLPQSSSSQTALPNSSSASIVRRGRKKAQQKWPCGICGWNYGDKKDPKISDEWLLCQKCLAYFHESCVNGKINDNDNLWCGNCL